MMTIRTRIGLGISAAAFSLSLALAPAVAAEDSMKQDLDFKNGLLSNDGGIRKSTVVREPVKKDEGTKRYSGPK